MRQDAREVGTLLHRGYAPDCTVRRVPQDCTVRRVPQLRRAGLKQHSFECRPINTQFAHTFARRWRISFRTVYLFGNLITKSVCATDSRLVLTLPTRTTGTVSLSIFGRTDRCVFSICMGNREKATHRVYCHYTWQLTLVRRTLRLSLTLSHPKKCHHFTYLTCVTDSNERLPFKSRLRLCDGRIQSAN
jgi:hypothetical protein